VLGAGSWGTALAIQLARAAQPTVLWGRAEDQPELLSIERCNRRYLPDAPFPDGLTIEPVLEKAVRSTNDVLVCVPSVAFRQVITNIKPYLTESSRIAWATKGFEQKTGKKSPGMYSARICR
jgi:glycerol-3-phosphate dehydrogenase (NAD(P)+)